MRPTRCALPIVTLVAFVILTMSPAAAWADTKIEAMFAAVVGAVSERTGLEFEPLLSTTDGCRPSGDLCEGYFGNTQVRAWGRGVLTVFTYSDVPFARYKAICGASLRALTGLSTKNSERTVEEAFAQAAERGRYKRDHAGVELEVRPDLSDRLGCELFAY